MDNLCIIITYYKALKDTVFIYFSYFWNVIVDPFLNGFSQFTAYHVVKIKNLYEVGNIFNILNFMN